MNSLKRTLFGKFSLLITLVLTSANLNAMEMIFQPEESQELEQPEVTIEEKQKSEEAEEIESQPITTITKIVNDSNKIIRIRKNKEWTNEFGELRKDVFNYDIAPRSIDEGKIPLDAGEYIEVDIITSDPIMARPLVDTNTGTKVMIYSTPKFESLEKIHPDNEPKQFILHIKSDLSVAKEEKMGLRTHRPTRIIESTQAEIPQELTIEQIRNETSKDIFLTIQDETQIFLKARSEFRTLLSLAKINNKWPYVIIEPQKTGIITFTKKPMIPTHYSLTGKHLNMILRIIESRGNILIIEEPVSREPIIQRHSSRIQQPS